MKFKYVLFVLLFVSLSLKVSAEHLKSLDSKNFDTNTLATKDFYQYVNKGWMDNHPLSIEQASYSQYDILNDSSNNRILRIITNLSKIPQQKGTNEYKIASLYSVAMDSVKRNRLGAHPIKDALSIIEDTSPENMTDLFLWLHKNSFSPFFVVSIM